jgi:hypothetical protein
LSRGWGRGRSLSRAVGDRGNSNEGCRAWRCEYFIAEIHKHNISDVWYIVNGLMDHQNPACDVAA